MKDVFMIGQQNVLEKRRAPPVAPTFAQPVFSTPQLQTLYALFQPVKQNGKHQR